MSADPNFQKVFGRYRILRKLGAGGMGSVYLAEDTQLDRKVALKVPHFDAARNDTVQRFWREARAAAGISHPNFCGIHDVGEVAGVPYLTMTYIEGTPLAELVGQPWPPLEAVALVRRLAFALSHLHERKLMHRDLKPANIVLRSDQEPVVVDFGLARSVTGTDRMTTTGTALGTPAYMSPEQIALGPEDVGPATDTFSLGAILYVLLTGRLPFLGTGHTLCYRIVHEDPAPPSQVAPGLDAALDGLCLKALAKKPSERYRQIADFGIALDGYMREKRHSLPVASGTKEQDSADGLPPGDRKTSGFGRRAAAWGVAAALLIVAGIIVEQLLSAHRAGKDRAPATLDAAPATAQTGRPARSEDSEPRQGFFNSIGMKFVRVEAGAFLMGSTEADDQSVKAEFPQHRVTCPAPFFLAAYKTTAAQFERVMKRNPSIIAAASDQKAAVNFDPGQLPADGVTFFDAVEFCNQLSRREGRRPFYRLSGVDRQADGWIKAAKVEGLADGSGYRLPSEAEWEYCARAGSATRYSFGDDPTRLGEHAWFSENSDNRIHQVGEKLPNRWGLFDLGGLVWEWCEDVWHEDYHRAPADGRAWLTGGDPALRVARGGAWDLGPRFCRCAKRYKIEPGGRYVILGFRVVLISP